MVRINESPEETALRRLRAAPPLPLWAALKGPAQQSARFTVALLSGYLGSAGATDREIAAFSAYISQYQTPASILQAVWGPDRERGTRWGA